MEKKLKIGLIGLGTVGCGVVKVISQRNDIEIVLCAVKNLSKKREVELNCLTDDIYKVVNHPDIDVVVEVAGGIGVFDALKCAIKN
ncbi:homoserine dehydrogenase, partial [bacterium]|nr:homoserine dehydrogenase [bacterium]